MAYCRCRYPLEYALANDIDHPKNVILREETMIAPVDQWLARELAPSRRDHVIAALAQPTADNLVAASDRTAQDNIIASYEAKINRYRAALDAGADPATVTSWIAEAQSERDNMLAGICELAPAQQPIRRLTTDEIIAVLDQLGDLVTALADADPDLKSDLYRELGLRQIYRPDAKTVQVIVDLDRDRWDLVRVEGGT